ncbi:MAG: cyclodeaminase/cyclohydrolase family protein [bacterium]
MFQEQKLSEFLSLLSSSAPTPGGGSASALSGAIGASLLAMVANLTIGKKKYADVEAEMKEALSRATTLRDEMSALIDEDARSFDAVMAAFKMPRETDDQKKARKGRIEEATKLATETPLRVMRKCLEGIDICSVVARKGNRNSISDAGVASLEFETATKGAMLNVLINLPGIQDESFKERAKTEADSIYESVESKSREILDLVRSKM